MRLSTIITKVVILLLIIKSSTIAQIDLNFKSNKFNNNFDKEKVQKIIFESDTLSADEPIISKLNNVNELLFDNIILKDFPKQLRELKNVGKINIENCNQSIDLILSNLHYFENLKILMISKTNICRLPTEFFKCQKLEDLEINKSDLKIIDNKINQLVNLKELWIVDCPNCEFDSEIGLPNLVFFRLWNVQNKIPFFIKNCPELEDFGYINSCPSDYSELIEILSNCKNLQFLSLEKCNLERIPNNINKLNKLTGVSFSRNKLKSIPTELSGLKIHKLLLDNNYISNVDNNIGLYKYLEYVDISNNLIDELSEDFYNMKGIKELNLSYNYIKKFAFDRLPSMCDSLTNDYINIDIRGNFIDSIPYFSDKSNRKYRITLTENNRKYRNSIYQEIAKECCQQFVFGKSELFVYSPPKGLMNMKFRGTLHVHYPFTEDEVKLLKKRFDNVILNY